MAVISPCLVFRSIGIGISDSPSPISSVDVMIVGRVSSAFSSLSIYVFKTGKLIGTGTRPCARSIDV